MVIIEPAVGMTRVGEAMNLLNGVAERFPEAISLAAGRPADEVARLSGLDAAIERATEGRSDSAVWQYGPTPGLMCEWTCEMLAEDEGIVARPAEVIATTGAQEAMFLVLAALFGPDDVLLVPDPIYVGITGAAAAADVPVVPIDATDFTGQRVAEAVEAVERAGRRVRGVYVVPDFQNPLGTTLALEQRRALLAVARDRGLWIIEDSPYRIFDFDGEPPPTLARLDDRRGTVIHIGSFAKALCPGLRLGFLAWPGGPDDAIDRLLRYKSFVTVNTSPISQAIAVGLVPRTEGGGPSLKRAGRAARAIYHIRRDALMAGLDASLAKIPNVRWARPAGGFFCRVDLPFVFDESAFARCAQTYGVIVCPMSMFSPGNTWRNTVRLSFSSASPAALAEGAERFGRFVASEVAGEGR